MGQAVHQSQTAQQKQEIGLSALPKTALRTLTESSRLNNYASAWTVYDLTPHVVLEAVRGVRERSLSYWDAQIWAVARMHYIPVVLSEDFQDGFLLEGVRFLNPLSAKAGAREWLESW